MSRLVSILLCVGVLEAAIVPLRLQTTVDQARPVLPNKKEGVALAEKKTVTEPTIISLPLKDKLVDGQQSFSGEISVGTPGQPMTVAVDVTSRITYVPSVNCFDPFCKSHKQYDSSTSATYVEDGTPFELDFQNATGVLSKDNIGIVGVTVQGQTFGEATAVYNAYTLNAPYDGVLGLGFGTKYPSEVDPILTTMADQSLVPERLVGLWLGRNGIGGELTIGGLNQERYRGELAWATIVIKPDDWVVLADSVAVGETSLCYDHCYVFTDNTSPYLFLSEETAKTVNDALGGTDIGQPGVAALDCVTLYTLPTLKIEIAGRTLEMSPLEYTFVLPLDDGIELCLSGFVGVPTVGDDAMMVGTLFMQKFYTAYDMDQGRVGFADSA